MDLRESPDHAAFRRHVRAWLAAHPAPEPLATFEARRAWHRTLNDAGFLGLTWPKEYGGRGATAVEEAIVIQELAAANAPGFINTPALGHIGPTLAAHGTEVQKKRHLAKILTADELWCQLYSEPGAGSDLASLRTTAAPAGDGWRVNGHKVWASGGPVADFAVLLAVTDPAAPKYRNLSYLIVDMRAPGVEMRPLRQITGDSEFAEVFLRDVRVPRENLIGAEGKGWELANSTLGFERAYFIVARLARYRANLAYVVESCRTLRRGGVPLIDDPVTRQKLGRMVVDLEVVRAASLRILAQLQSGALPGIESSVDKLHFSEMELVHNDLILDVLGPFGQVEEGLPADLELRARTFRGHETTIPFNFLFSRAATIGAGTSEILRTVIGERILGLPREARADRAGTKA